MSKDLQVVYEGKWIEGLAGRNVSISRVTQDHAVYLNQHGSPCGYMTAEQLASFGFKALTTEEILEGQDYPKVGEEIYVKTSLYLSHGADDFIGGLARVSRVAPMMSAGDIVPGIEVEEKPGSVRNWVFASQEQDKLREQFGDSRAHPDPDMRPEFNEW